MGLINELKKVMNKSTILETLNKIEFSFEKKYICPQIVNLETYLWFIRQEVPDKFKGPYFVKQTMDFTNWWNVYAASNDGKLSQLLELKQDYINYLIKKVENDENYT